MSDREPETCTVELTTGSFVHLAQARALFARQNRDSQNPTGDPDCCSAPSPIEQFRRVTGLGVTGWRDVWLDVTQIVAVYSVTARPEAPMVYSVLAAGGYVPPGV